MTFEEVYDRFRQPIWRLARRLTENDEEALDATQEIFLRVWRGLGGFRGESKLSTWVFQIAWNHLRWHRRQMGRHDVFIESGTDTSEDTLARAPNGRPDPERRTAAAVELERVERAIDTLSERHRVVLWLRDAEGLSYEEIATVLDVPLGTVRSRLARARQALRKAVDR